MIVASQATEVVDLSEIFELRGNYRHPVSATPVDVLRGEPFVVEDKRLFVKQEGDSLVRVWILWIAGNVFCDNFPIFC